MTKVHHVVGGPLGAPPLVLSNSLGTTLEMWDPQAAALAERFRLVRYDRRGHGRSPVPPGPYRIEDLGADVLGLLDRLGLERVSFCGLSIGGLVGMWLASEAPARIDRLVLCCTAPVLPPPEAWLERAAVVRAAGVATLADAVLGRWFTADFHAEQHDAVERFRAMLVATPAEGYAACCEAIGALDLRPRLAAIGARTLVITGAEDPVVAPATGAALADAIAGARHVVIPGAAHIANVEQPEAFTAALLAHLSDTGLEEEA
jgi:3-oxoadipate enol-lactonase